MTDELLGNTLIYLFLPLWSVAGFVDWICHRRTKIEHTSGLFESVMHSIMGIQIGIPIFLCLFFLVNESILLLCILAWVLHEVVAHADVLYASPKREIRLCEVHAHNYLATLPLFMLVMIAVLNWEAFYNLVSFNWQGPFEFTLRETPVGFDGYMQYYIAFMFALGVVPYFEENLRCLRIWLINRNN